GQRDAVAQHQRRQGPAGGAARRRSAQDSGQPEALRYYATYCDGPGGADRAVAAGQAAGLRHRQRREYSLRALGLRADPRPPRRALGRRADPGPERRGGGGAERRLSQIFRSRVDVGQPRAAGNRRGAQRVAHAWHAICNAVDWVYGEWERRDMMRVKFWMAAAA